MQSSTMLMLAQAGMTTKSHARNAHIVRVRAVNAVMSHLEGMSGHMESKTNMNSCAAYCLVRECNNP